MATTVIRDVQKSLEGKSIFGDSVSYEQRTVIPILKRRAFKSERFNIEFIQESYAGYIEMSKDKVTHVDHDETKWLVFAAFSLYILSKIVKK